MQAYWEPEKNLTIKELAGHPKENYCSIKEKAEEIYSVPHEHPK